MFSTKEEIKAINSYFKKFLLEHRDDFFDDLLKKSINRFELENSTDFSKNWNNLIFLMQTIEHVYDLKSIVTEKNYFRFEFHTGENIQDKGGTKIEALFSCCYQTLTKYWDKNPPNFNRGFEPFDEIDLG